LEFINNRCAVKNALEKDKFLDNLDKLFSLMGIIAQQIKLLHPYITADDRLKEKTTNFLKFYNLFLTAHDDLFIKIACLMCAYKALYSFISDCNHYNKIENIINSYGNKLFLCMPYGHAEKKNCQDFLNIKYAKLPGKVEVTDVSLLNEAIDQASQMLKISSTPSLGTEGKIERTNFFSHDTTRRTKNKPAVGEPLSAPCFPK
ncbi:MAG: hypothetical protein ACK4PR_04435, partial [Gammaproteobacteria bacterium]